MWSLRARDNLMHVSNERRAIVAVLKRSSSAVRSLTAWRKLRTSAKDLLTVQGERRTILHHRGEDTLRSYGDGTTLVPRLSYAAYACVELVPRSPHALTAFHHVCATLLVRLSEHVKVKSSSAQAQAASQNFKSVDNGNLA